MRAHWAPKIFNRTLPLPHTPGGNACLPLIGYDTDSEMSQSQHSILFRIPLPLPSSTMYPPYRSHSHHLPCTLPTTATPIIYPVPSLPLPCPPSTMHPPYLPYPLPSTIYPPYRTQAHHLPCTTLALVPPLPSSLRSYNTVNSTCFSWVRCLTRRE